MIYPIIAYGDPVLKKVAEDIPNDGSFDVQQLSKDMFETMYNASGVGLAAPQIGKSLRMFVIDSTQMMDEGKESEGLIETFINAKVIEEYGDLSAMEEGCLSIPSIRENITRLDQIKISYFNLNWEKKEEIFYGMNARVIQHEYDHIEGVLFTDKVSSLKKRLIRSKLNNISKGKIKHDYKMKFPLVK